MLRVALLAGLALTACTGCNPAISKCESAVERAQTNEAHFFTAAMACGDACTETDDHAICLLTDSLFTYACKKNEPQCVKACAEAPPGASKDKACTAVEARKLGRAARVSCNAAVESLETAMGILDHGQTMAALGEAAKTCAAACASDSDTCYTLSRVADSLCALDRAICKTRCESDPPSVAHPFCERATLTHAEIENPVVRPPRLCGRAAARYSALAASEPTGAATSTALRNAIAWCDVSCRTGRKDDCRNIPGYVEVACADRTTCRSLCDLDDTARPSSKLACARLIDRAP